MTPTAWFALLHPVLMILFVYPVVGATIRLGTLARERRLEINPLPPTVGVEHAEHGRWVATGTVVAVLIAMAATYAMGEDPGMGGPSVALLLAGIGCLLSCLALWRAQAAWLRTAFALICWLGLLTLGSQPALWHLGRSPFDGAAWGSHYWSGVLLCGLLLFAMAAAPEILRSPVMRRLHVGAAFLTALLLAVQAISGSRDLLGMALAG
ncbi:MAG: membrane protein [Cyanobium sp. CACIAM 14]|nr:MAG: membrane protein [Cyanobium sp. CACIAM 14]